MKRNIKRHISEILMVGVLFIILMLSETGTAQGNEWIPTGSMAYARRGHTSTLLTTGKVLIVGSYSNIAELYDPATGTFNLTGNTLYSHGRGCTATLLLDGRVLVAGGSGALTSAEIYDPVTETFTATGSLNHVHMAHTATLLPDGRVLIAAGQDNVGPQTHAIAEIYDSLTGSFSPTGNLNEHRSEHTATLLPNNLVLITGGTQTTTPPHGIQLTSAELYDPVTGVFSLTDDMDTGRTSHMATLLLDGRVLITGGLITDSAELYDPTTDTFSPANNTIDPRDAHTATLLPSGQVLIAGGCIEVGPVVTNSAELYDPVTGEFSLTDSMNTARLQYAATLLDDGRVLVTGGYDGIADTSSAELYRVYTIDELIERIKDEVPDLPGNSEISLINQLDKALEKLAEARDSFDDGDLSKAQIRYCQAIGKIRDFITIVEAKVPNQIPPEIGDELIAAAEELIYLIEKEMEDAGLPPCN